MSVVSREGLAQKSLATGNVKRGAKPPSRALTRLVLLCLPILGCVILLMSIPARPMTFRERLRSLHPGSLEKDVVAQIGKPTENRATPWGHIWAYRRMRGTFVIDFVHGRAQRFVYVPRDIGGPLP